MARFDKYNPVGGGFRAPLAAAVASTDIGGVFAVGIDSAGKVVRGTGQTGYVGVICPGRTFAAGQPIDVMTHGEIVEFTTGAAGAAFAAAAAGTNFYGGSSGALTVTAPGAGTNAVKLGHTVEASRLVVRVGSFQG